MIAFKKAGKKMISLRQKEQISTGRESETKGLKNANRNKMQQV